MMDGTFEKPLKAGELKPYKDKVFVYLGKERGWKPQLSVLNCNKLKIWKLLTEQKNSTFHYLERSECGKNFIYSFEKQKWLEFDSEIHTPSW